MRTSGLLTLGVVLLVLAGWLFHHLRKRSAGAGRQAAPEAAAAEAAAAEAAAAGVRDTAARLRALLASVVRTAYDPVVEAGEADGPVSKFGGRPWLPDGTDWPVCPGCGHPMQFFVQLDTATLPDDVGVGGDGLIQLFACLGDSGEGTCLGTWEAYADAEVVRLVDSSGPGRLAAGEGQSPPWPARRIVGWTPFEDWPGQEDVESDVAAVAATKEMEALYERLYEAAAENPEAPFPAYGDKLGGWPSWVQGPEWPACRECGERMHLVLQIDSEDNIPTMLGDVGRGHVCQCPHHPHILTWAWACH